MAITTSKARTKGRVGKATNERREKGGKPLKRLESRKKSHFDFVASSLDFVVLGLDFVAAGLENVAAGLENISSHPGIGHLAFSSISRLNL
jgi:hypothetical protein